MSIGPDFSKLGDIRKGIQHLALDKSNSQRNYNRSEPEVKFTKKGSSPQNKDREYEEKEQIIMFKPESKDKDRGNGSSSVEKDFLFTQSNKELQISQEFNEENDSDDQKKQYKRPPTGKDDKMQKKQKDLQAHMKKLGTQLARTENEMAYGKRGQSGNKTLKVGDERHIIENEQLREENKRLKEKLIAFASTTSDPKQKKQYKSIGQEDPNILGRDAQKIKDLLKMIDIQKKQIREGEENNKRLQGIMNSKVSLVSKDQNDKNQKVIGIKAQYDELNIQLDQKNQHFDQLRHKMSEINAELRDTREKLLTAQSMNKTLELRVRNAEDMEKDIEVLKKERDSYEERLKNLSKSPFFKEHEQRVDQQSKIKDLQSDLDITYTKSKNMKDDNQSLIITNEELNRQIKTLSAELMDLKDKNTTYRVKLDSQDSQMAPFRALQTIKPELYTKALGEIRYLSETPLWQNIPEIKEVLNIDPERGDKEQLDIFKNQVKDLKQQNGELAAHLEKTETMLKTRIDIEREKEKLHKAELDKLNLQLQAALKRATELTQILEFQGGTKVEQKAIDKQGVAYDDTVSVFSADDEDDTEGNYMDLWIGSNTFEQQNIENASDGKIQDGMNLLSFITSDFYNHDTQHTNISEGVIPNYNFQMTYKVQIDQFFVQYLETNSIKIDVYGAIGTDAVKLGSANIKLNDLIIENRSKDVSAVVKSKLYIYSKNDNQRVMCCLDYRLRMRRPIFETINWLNEQRKLNIVEKQPAVEEKVASRNRSLVIIVDKATGLPPKTASFVYYQLEGQDFLTSTMPAQNPNWDDHRVHEINYNEQFVGFIKQNQLQFIIFDDSVAGQDGGNDIIGKSYMKLNGLIQNKVINSTLDIKNSDNQKIGNLFVKVFWLETEEKMSIKETESLISQTWEQDITLKIAQNLRKRGLGVQTAFNVFDRDENKIIDYEEFEQTIIQTLNINFMENELRVYFSKLPQPLNQKNFDLSFKPYLLQVQEEKGGYPGVSNKGAITSQINQLLSTTNKLQKNIIENIKLKILDLLEAKLNLQIQLVDLFTEIDINGDGNIGIFEMKTWLFTHGLHENDEDVYQFLIACDTNKNKKVGLLEFFEFILEETHPKQIAQLRIFKGKGLDNDPSMRSWQDKALINYVKERILEFMHTKKMTFQMMHKSLSKQSNFLSKKELQIFLESKTEIPIDTSNMNVVFNFFDVNRDGKISLDEFMNSLRIDAKLENKKNKYNELFKGEKAALNQNTTQQICMGLSMYMMMNKITIAQLFNELDKNNDGRLGRQEMKKIFQTKMEVPMDDDKFQEFFDHFDINRDNIIQIQEFVKVITPYLDQQKTKLLNEGIKKSSSSQDGSDGLSADYTEKLKKKGFEVAQRNEKEMHKQFKLQSNNGTISKKEFKRILSDYCALTDKELDIFIKQFLKLNYQDDILYLEYLQQANPYQKYDQTGVSSQLGARIQRETAKECFEQIRDVLDKKKINYKQAFEKMDKDQDGMLDKHELRMAFQQMGLEQYATDNNIDDIFHACDQNGDDRMDYYEFIKILRL